MTQVNSGTKQENKEVCVLIRIKPKYTKEFCIMMIAFKELCNRVSKFKKLAKIENAFSVLGPFDFLLEIREKKYLFRWNEQSQDEKKLKQFLMEDFDAGWVKDIESKWRFKKIVFDDGKNKIILNKEGDKVILSINDEKTCELVKKVDKDGVTDIYRKEEEVDERINRTIFKIRETLGSYIYETHTLTKFELSKFLKDDCRNLYDYFEDKSEEVSETAETTETGEKDELEKLNAFLKENCKILYDYFKYKSKEASDTAETTEIEKKDELKKLNDFLKENCKIDYFEDKSKEASDTAETTEIGEKDELDEFKKCLDKETLCRLCGLRNRFEKAGTQININKTWKHVHVLIKVKPDCTEKFLLAMTIFKSLCNNPASRNLAKIQDEKCSIFGPFDFIFELIAKGVEGKEEEMTEKINRTIFEIRETLGSYIYETHTIEKFKIPMTKEDLESFFKKKLGEEYLVRLPDRDGEKVPHERHKPHDKIDLKEIRDAETTALTKLLENAKTFLEPENLDERVIDLNSRVEELEKRQGLRQR